MVTLYTRHKFDSRKKAAELLKAFNEVGGAFKPARFGDREPVRKAYDPRKLSEPSRLLSGAPDFEGGAVMLKGAKYKFLAWIKSEPEPEEISTWEMWLSDQFFERAEHVEEFVRFLTLLCERFPILFGSACPNEDWEAKHWVSVKGGPFLSKAGTTLDRCLPGVYWMTVFGPPLVEHFGRERIESLPVWRVMDFGAGGLGVVLRDSPYRPEKKERLSQDAEIMRLLGEDYFFDAVRPERPCRPVPSVTRGGAEQIKLPGITASAPEFGVEDLKNVTVLDAVGEPVTDLSDLAEMLVVFLHGEVNEASEYSRAALEAIDAHFAEHPQRVEYKPEHLNKEFIPTLGAYLGEVLVRNLGAEWAAREPLPKSTIRLGGTEVSPFESAYGSVYEGTKLADVYDSLARRPGS